MEVAEIGNKLYELVLKNSHDFSPHYSKYEQDFLEWHQNFNGLKTTLRLDASSLENTEIIKLSSLLFDFTSYFPYHHENFLYTFDPDTKDRYITGNSEHLDQIKRELPDCELYGGYASISEDLLEETFENLLPLIQAGKLLIRPEKIIFAAELNTTFRTMVHPADPNGRKKEWKAVLEESDQSTFPLFDRKSSVEQHHQVGEILMPYLSGISVPDFTKIIVEESDLLSSFRFQLKCYMQMLRDSGSNAIEFKADIIQPKLDTLNRKFKSISNIHKLKVAGTTVGTVALGLLSLSQSGIVASMSQFISFGLGTVGFVKNESEYQSALEQMKDTPEYLLWKLSRKL